MISQKTNPRGIDLPIQQLQKWLYGRLCAKWGFDGSEWKCCDRAYKNQGEKGYIPEVYVGGIEYKDAFYDDNYAVISFFYAGDDRKIGTGISADVSLIFSLDITKVRPGIAHRADEEVHIDVMNELKIARFGFQMTDLITGIDNVFSDFTVYKRAGVKSNTEKIKYRDMHPLHCFRVDFALNYQNSNC